MSGSTITLTLPFPLYEELSRRARGHNRELEDEATLALAAALEESSGRPNLMVDVLDSVAALDDESLWRVSETRPTVEDGVLLDTLVEKRRRHGITPAEERLLAELVDRHDQVMALRAEAIALLAQRGIDVRERLARA